MLLLQIPILTVVSSFYLKESSFRTKSAAARAQGCKVFFFWWPPQHVVFNSLAPVSELCQGPISWSTTINHRWALVSNYIAYGKFSKMPNTRESKLEGLSNFDFDLRPRQYEVGGLWFLIGTVDFSMTFWQIFYIDAVLKKGLFKGIPALPIPQNFHDARTKFPWFLSPFHESNFSSVGLMCSFESVVLVSLINLMVNPLWTTRPATNGIFCAFPFW